MIVCHISAHTSYGAGSVAKRLYLSSLRLIGVDSTLWSLDHNNSRLVSILRKCENYFKYNFLSILGNFGSVKKSNFFFGLFPSTVLVSKQIKGMDHIDVFFIYWIDGLISKTDLSLLSRRFPTSKYVFILLDEGNLTGGCHYTGSCTNFNSACLNCPNVGLSMIKKKIFKNYIALSSFVSDTNSVLVFPSRFMHDKFQNSNIYYWAKKRLTKYLSPYTIKEFSDFLPKRILYLKEEGDYLNILLRSSNEKRKGCFEFYNIVFQCIQNGLKFNNFKFHVIGDDYLEGIGFSNLVDTTYHGYLNREQLFDLYSKIDCFIMTSIEDSGPIMVNESLGLGIYVVSNNVGVGAELITEENGVLFEYANGIKFLHKINKGYVLKYNRSNFEKLMYNEINLTDEAYISDLIFNEI